MSTTTLKRLLKCEQFDSKMRMNAVTSDWTKIIIVPSERRVRLNTEDEGDGLGSGYATDVDLSVTLPVHSIGQLVSWDMVQVIGETPKDLSLNQVTSIKMRLWDGASHFYWAAGWVPATLPAHWNTIEEVNTNIGAWDADTDLGVVLNLATTDREYTPSVTEILLLCTVSLPDFIEDWIYDTIIAQLQDDIRPMTDAIHVSDGTTSVTVSFGDDYIDWLASVDSIDGVWNLTTDPKKRTNLYSSLLAGVVTLTGAPTTGDSLLVRAKYAPVVAVQTDMDFEDDASVPSLTFTGIDTVDFGVGGGDSHIMNIYASPPSGVIVPAPRRAHVDFSLEARAPLAIDLLRMVAEVVNWMDTNMAPQSAQTGEKATLVVTQTFSRSSTPGNSGLHTANMQFRLLDINNWNRPAIVAGAPGSDGQGYGVGSGTFRYQVGGNNENNEITE
jgi:hypothetical protein